ncbi:MAG: AI-2E family transporter [Ottowia sp.]|nr:AI-2E family transporter [Ottowia sp.]MBP7455053.1 AI-2E family transporter [Ottowia sp.]MBP7457345.1 AI-2E family transporter [Ottowia sp.]MBP8860168.1 AI-2E family transporter [Ottowia sp.]MBP8927912.1 AI-2E family transporter [Ottowia sp.]
MASHVAMAASLLLIMWQGLLPGLLCVCLGFLATRWFSPRLGALTRAHDHQAPKLAAGLVALIPVVLIAVFLPRTRGVILDAPNTYRELLAFMARTVLELRDRLPPDIAAQLPTGAEDVQRVIAAYLATKAGTLATTGRAWLSGLLFAYIGLLVGALAAARPSVIMLKPLAAQLHLRLTRFGETFRQIVVAQFWIALFNTFLTAIFLLVVLPLWDSRLPYTMALILLTFLAGLIPIVGNLICNGVLTLVGLSVSPLVALACLVFLIAIHKAEYFINAKVIGHRTHMGVWELLAVMFVMEAVFGPAGLVAAPLFYAYTKKELQASGWV